MPVLIAGVMVFGVLLGRAFPSPGEDLDSVRFAGISLPIGLGLLWMMYPVLARVRYGAMLRQSAGPRIMSVSLVLN